jgi:hypothetical protein
MAKNITEPGIFGQISSAPLLDYVPVTPGAGDLPDGPCRAILATAAGTVNLTTIAGDQRNGVPVNAGVNPLAARAIRAGGTATGLFAGY